MKAQKKPRLVVVLGPTSSGKSDLAVIIAKKFNGEVISADSRQVYTGMDIGTGKVTKKEMAGIPHHLLDVADPKKRYSVSRFKRDANRAISDIVKRGKLPILCGGTGFYIQAIVDGLILPEVKPDKKLRKELETCSTKELFSQLKNARPGTSQGYRSTQPPSTHPRDRDRYSTRISP
jgi:tRNA dimethylallyltransferase